MKKVVLALVCVVLAAGSIVNVSSVAVAADEVNFPDPVLREAIRSAIGGGNITQAKLDLLTSFSYGSLADPDVTDLTGIEHCTSLRTLNLEFNQISDMSAVEGLTSLRVLRLGENEITDISIVEGLTNLQVLRLYGNQIGNITAVAALADLRDLNIHSNSIEDISAVAGLASLTKVILSTNEISDISAVAGLTNLQFLRLHSNRISSIVPIIANSGIGPNDYVDVRLNPLDVDALCVHIPELESRGATVDWTPPLVGDANMDGIIDGRDVIRCKRIILGLEEPYCGADANEDCVIDGRDVIRIKKMVLGI
jgi:hypothetical protein